MIILTNHEVYWERLKEKLKEMDSDVLSIMNEMEEKGLSMEEMDNERLKKFFETVQKEVKNEKDQNLLNMIKKVKYERLSFFIYGWGISCGGEGYITNLAKEILNRRSDNIHHSIEYAFQQKGYRTGYYPYINIQVSNGTMEGLVNFSPFQKDMFDRNDISIEEILNKVFHEFDITWEVECK